MFCSNFNEDYAKLQQRALSAIRHAGSKLSIPKDQDLSQLNSKQLFNALENEALAQAGISRDYLAKRFEIVRDAVMSAVQFHPLLPEPLKAQMINKLHAVRLLTLSEFTDPTDKGFQHPICGDFGLAESAFANAIPSQPPIIVLCPGRLLDQGIHGNAPALDLVMAHEISHHMDSNRFSIYGPYLSCLTDILAVPIPDTYHANEIIADYWAMQAFIQLNPGASAEKLRDRISANLVNRCEGVVLSDKQDWSDVHLPDDARLSQTVLYHPEIKKLLGCGSFTKANPGCDLNGMVPTNQ